MTREEWYDHLRNATGPLALDQLGDIAAHADDELLALLRDLAVNWPDPEKTSGVEEALPLFAAILLGLLHDVSSTRTIMDGLKRAHVEDWDWYTIEAPRILQLMGPEAFPIIREELERLEREPELDPVPPYYYWTLVEALTPVGDDNPSVRDEYVQFASERITGSLDEDHTVIWISSNIDGNMPELRPVVDAFFERMGPDYDHEIFGTREMYWEIAGKIPRADARKEVLKTYGRYRRRLLEPEPEWEPGPGAGSDPGYPDNFTGGVLGTYDDYGSHQPFVRSEPKIGRNDPCPCGSGKKYKKCHGA